MEHQIVTFANPYDGDENEDFHWHDKRRRRSDKVEKNKSHGGQRVQQIVSNEFNT